MTYTITIKPSDVYKNENAQSLDKFLKDNNLEVVGFRPPQMGDDFILCTGGEKFGVVTETFNTTHSNITSPRFIVREVKPPTSIWE